MIATIVALVAVGVSHHLVVGLVTALVLAVTAPRLWRWFQVRWVRVR